jgi:hypothetical protein
MILTFEPVPGTEDGEHPEGAFSRAAWLPAIGPSCWLVWGSIASSLRSNKARLPDGRALVAWSAESLARAHGLKLSEAAHAPLRKSLARLCRFDLFAAVAPDLWKVRLSAPPLTEAQLLRSPAYIGVVQRNTFGAPAVAS